tara:strand:+ start:354 stop:509 length:156 start_codon:yes stop_codon:yes gene_type:complete
MHNIPSAIRKGQAIVSAYFKGFVFVCLNVIPNHDERPHNNSLSLNPGTVEK